MSEVNKALLRKGNAAIRAGDNEAFLALCAQDIRWSTVGGEMLQGIEAVRAMMKKDYVEPPVFTEDQMIEDGDYVVALGNITTKNDDGTPETSAYADVWRVQDGKLAELKAFLVPLPK